ncbi:hypothetical protein [Paenibacillus harenae]|uniref:hypothetical protein n=1 Tax=Paenibacillus harenae TaxID=306543 RepID=UPI0027D8D591|nr:hypothetical protein [Paenibacillus harenae]
MSRDLADGKKITRAIYIDTIKKVEQTTSDSATIVSFTDLAAKSKAPLAYITQQKDEEGESSEDGTNTGNGLKTSVFEILIVGHLENLLTYMDNQQRNERLFAIKKWTFTELKPSDIGNDYPDLYKQPFMDRNKPVLSLKMNIEAYSMPQYEDSLLKEEQAKEGQASA